MDVGTIFAVWFIAIIMGLGLLTMLAYVGLAKLYPDSLEGEMAKGMVDRYINSNFVDRVGLICRIGAVMLSATIFPFMYKNNKDE